MFFPAESPRVHRSSPRPVDPARARPPGPRYRARTVDTDAATASTIGTPAA